MKTSSSGRKEVQTSRNVNIDFSAESSAIAKTSAVIASESSEKQLDSMDSTVCLDFNVKSSEEETVCAEVIHAAYGTAFGSRWASTSAGAKTSQQPITKAAINHNHHASQPSSTLQPRPSDGTASTLATSTKVKSKGRYFATYLKVQQQNENEPELLEKDRSIRKSLSRLLFRRGGVAGSQKTGLACPTSRNSISESTTSCNSSFCSKAGAAPISRSAIAHQLLERINNNVQHQQKIQDFDEDEEDEEEVEGCLEEGDDNKGCNRFCNSNSSNSSQDDSSSSPLSLRSLSLPTAYRSNFILRENMDIYTTPHLCRGQPQ